MSFQEFGFNQEILRAIKEKGYETPTPIQSQAIPTILSGSDLLAGSQTGTGKTAGFTLPLIQKLAGKKSYKIRALILTPTRELAAQVEESVRLYSKYTNLRSTVVYGGVSMHMQKMKLKKGVDILVATPGRLLDLVNQRAIDLSAVEIFVLDEADRMLDMGFLPDIRKTLSLMPKDRQNLLFSATFSNEIRKLSDTILVSPKVIEVARNSLAAEKITQKVHPVDSQRKPELLTHLIRFNNWEQVLVFTRTKHGADRLTKQLSQEGISALAIHGDKTQGARSRALSDFKKGVARVLVATDIAARGLDIQHLPYVVNFDLPDCPEDYVHRIGRTGRAGCEGEAISLVCVDEHKLLRDIERMLKKEIVKVTVPSYEPNPNVRPERPQHRRFFGGGRNKFRGRGRR